MNIGRPVKDLDLSELKELMRLYPSLEETAGWFKCSPDTISRHIRANENLNFAEFRARYTATTKLGLKRVAIDKAMQGDSKMLTFCLKNLCGWSEKELALAPIHTMSTNDLISEIKALSLEMESN